jgi:hypothetical protein
MRGHVLDMAMSLTERLEIEPGRCAFCGCTEQSACNAVAFAKYAWRGLRLPRRRRVSGCSWANKDKTVCSVCDAVLKRLAELPEHGYKCAIDLTEVTREAFREIRSKRG